MNMNKNRSASSYNRWMAGAAVVCLAASLGGCTTYKWVHPTKPESQVDRAMLDCESKAATMYPTVMVQESQGDTRKGGTSRCETVNGASKCETTGETFVQGATYAKDANENNRALALERCMRADGWRKVEVKKK